MTRTSRCGACHRATGHRADCLYSDETRRLLDELSERRIDQEVDMSSEAIAARVEAEFTRPTIEPIQPGNGSVWASSAGLPGHGKRR